MSEKEKEKSKISESLNKLEDIVSWFEQQKQADIEEGLKKVREGAALVKDLKEKLKRVENEFQEIKKTMTDNNAEEE